MIEMSKTLISLESLPSVSRALISADKRRFPTYVTDVLGSVNNCYARQVSYDGHIETLRVGIKRYKNYEER